MEDQGTLQLFSAVVALQSELKSVKRDVQAHRYKYADLTQCWDAVQPLLLTHGLCIMQIGVVKDGQQILRTVLAHKGGGSISGDFLINPGENEANDAQRIGSWWTYARRYSLMGLLGLTAEDDDGLAASTSATSPGSNGGTNWDPNAKDANWKKGLVTKPQLSAINTIMCKKFDRAQCVDIVLERFGHEMRTDNGGVDLGKLTKGQASEFIDDLNSNKVVLDRAPV